MEQRDLQSNADRGAFGRRLPRPATHLAQIAKIAMLVSYPVKLMWSREEEFAQGPCRPQITARLKAALDDKGKVTAWSNHYIWQNRAAVAARIFYKIPNVSLRYVATKTPVADASWRAVEHTQGTFYTESFMDELAHAAGVDPIVFRRDLLSPGSRERRVLDEIARLSEWGKPLPAGVGRGIAIAESTGTFVAQVVEASADQRNRPRVHKVIAVVDCGLVVHPDTARQQIEGSIVMGLSAAIGERITLENGAVSQRSFPDYPLLTLADAPKIEVHFLKSDAPMGGLGEPGLPPVAPALANALFAATGRRVRELPFNAERSA
jgi:isoquinoline 1-oxidoreductase subunit beta